METKLISETHDITDETILVHHKNQAWGTYCLPEYKDLPWLVAPGYKLFAENILKFTGTAFVDWRWWGGIYKNHPERKFSAEYQKGNGFSLEFDSASGVWLVDCRGFARMSTPGVKLWWEYVMNSGISRTEMLEVNAAADSILKPYIKSFEDTRNVPYNKQKGITKTAIIALNELIE